MQDKKITFFAKKPYECQKVLYNNLIRTCLKGDENYEKEKCEKSFRSYVDNGNDVEYIYSGNGRRMAEKRNGLVVRHKRRQFQLARQWMAVNRRQQGWRSRMLLF